MSIDIQSPKVTSSHIVDAFKEQLKSDEASRNKAEKKAKKELEEERSKPVSHSNGRRT